MTPERTDAAHAGQGHHRKVGVLGAAALVAGGMIGSGYFLLPATMAAIGSISILGWLAATAAALAIAGVFAMIGRAAPRHRPPAWSPTPKPGSASSSACRSR